MDTPVTIVQVRVQTTSNGRQKYDVDCGDGVTRTVWESNIANALNAFAGTNQQVTIRWSEKQNGQYTNRTIHAFAPPGQALPADTGQGGGQGGGFKRGGGMSEDDKTRISKMGAQGSAAVIIGSLFQGAGPEALDEALEKFDKLVVKLYKSARSHEKPGTQVLQTGQQGQVLPQGGVVQQEAAQGQVLPQVGQPVTTPQEVAQAVPGVQVGTDSITGQQAAEAADAPATDDVDWT